MATVIRNPIILHCLQQFGITPAEARAATGDSTAADAREYIDYAALLTVPTTPHFRDLDRSDRK